MNKCERLNFFFHYLFSLPVHSQHVNCEFQFQASQKRIAQLTKKAKKKKKQKMLNLGALLIFVHLYQRSTMKIIIKSKSIVLIAFNFPREILILTHILIGQWCKRILVYLMFIFYLSASQKLTTKKQLNPGSNLLLFKYCKKDYIFIKHIIIHG